MKYLILISSLILFSFYNEKKIKKIAVKTWKQTDITLREQSSNLEDVLQSYVVLRQNDTIGSIYIVRSYGCKVGGCSAPTKENKQSSTYEAFEFALFLTKNRQIKKVEILNYSGEYGYEICRGKWLHQFQQKPFPYILDENIDGISGATISATHLIESINKILASL